MTVAHHFTMSFEARLRLKYYLDLKEKLKRKLSHRGEDIVDGDAVIALLKEHLDSSEKLSPKLTRFRLGIVEADKELASLCKRVSDFETEKGSPCY